MTLLSDLARAVDIGLTVLSHRILTLLALLMTFALFCWAIVLGTWISTIVAGAFGAFIFLPVLVISKYSVAKPEAPHEQP